MPRKFELYGIGNAIMDLQHTVEETDIERLGLEKSHMRLVSEDQQKHLLEAFAKNRINQASGGSAANTMIAFAQLGGRGSYGCVVGDDEFGRDYLAEMKALGVEISAAPRQKKSTGSCVVLITPDAERTMNTHLGASAEFSVDDVSEEHIRSSEWLFVEGYLFSTENGRRAVAAAIDYATRNKTKIAVTFSDAFIVNGFRQPLEQCVSAAHLVFANVSEAKAFVKEEDEDRAFQMLRTMAPNVVMTMSERGARAFYDGSEDKISPIPARAVDDTGAGDVFAGGFLYGITHGMTGARAGKLGCVLGSTVVSQLGARITTNVHKLANDFGIEL